MRDSTSPAHQPLVTIIILTYNSANFILLCLESLSYQTYRNFEIIIVDNASTDNTVPLIESCPGPWQLIKNPKNLGCAGGNNIGAQAAKGAILVFLNPDVVVTKNWLEELIRPIIKQDDIAITGCKIYYPNTHIIQHAGAVIYPNAMTEHIGRDEQDQGQYDQAHQVDYVTGASLAVRRDCFEALSGFDTDYYPAYYEEADLCYRARKQGWKVGYVPTALIYHYEAPGLGKFSPGFYQYYYKSRIRFLLKNYSLSDWLVKFLPFEIKWFLCEPKARGLRLIQGRAYWQGIKFAAAKLWPFKSGDKLSL